MLVLYFCFLLDVGSWKFDVGRSSFKPTLYGINTAYKQLQNNIALVAGWDKPPAQAPSKKDISQNGKWHITFCQLLLENNTSLH
jgi:hypothetical protein